MNLPLKKIFLTIYSTFIASFVSTGYSKGSREGTVRISPSPSLTLHLQTFPSFYSNFSSFSQVSAVGGGTFFSCQPKCVLSQQYDHQSRLRHCVVENVREDPLFCVHKGKSSATDVTQFLCRQTDDLKVGTPYPTFFSAQHFFLPFVYIDKNARPDVPFVSFFNLLPEALCSAQ